LRPAHDPVQAARGRIETALGFATTPGVVLWPLAQDASPLWQALHGLQQEGRIRFWSGLERAATAAGRAALADFRARTRDFPALAQAQFTAAGLDAEAFAPAVRELAASFARDGDAAASATTVPFAGVTQRVVTVWPAARLDDRAFAALAADVAARAGGAATLHGTPTITAALADMLRADLLRAVATAAALAWLMVTLWLRSVRAGMLALLPSLLGLVAMLGVLVAIELPLSLVSFVAVPFVLGIGVDEGVHMVGQFRHGARTTGATGVGVVRTSYGTALGFAALATASSPGLVELGVLVAGGSVMCMLACLFVLAPLLARRGTSNGARVSSAP
jgi:predicted exporter